jgi:hypothetical protein
MSGNRDAIQECLENHLDSLHFTYSQHFAVANANRWLGRIIDVAIFTISGAVVISDIAAALNQLALITLLLTTAGLSAVHRATKPGEQENRFRDSARAHHDRFKRGTDFLRLDLHRDDVTDEEVRARYDEFFEEHLELNREIPAASTFWDQYMKYVRGDDQMEEEIKTLESKREALLGDNDDD